MKLLINYDFFNAIRNVNEKTNLLKVIRNEKGKYAVMFPIYLSIPLIAMQNGKITPRDIALPIIRGYTTLISLDFFFEWIIQKYDISNMDLYGQKSSRRLKELAVLLSTINVNTNYDMLLASELYYKKTSIEPSEGTFPVLKSEKYIYVPSYGFDGEEKTTSILQEHVVGTREYELSVEEPDRQFRRVLAKSHI